MPVQPHSSADAYAQRQDSRPCSSLSMLSGSNELGDSPQMRDGHLRRGSVLSFQTAQSGGMGGYTSNEDMSVAATGMSGLGSEEFEHLDNAAPRKPWLLHAPETINGGRNSATSAYSSSPDDFLPGGWKSRAWLNEVGSEAMLPASTNKTPITRKPAPQSPTRLQTNQANEKPRMTDSPSTSAAKGWHTPESSNNRSPAQSPRLPRIDHPANLDLGTLTTGSGSLLTPQLTPQARMLSPSSASSTIDADSFPTGRASEALLSNETLGAPKRQGTFSTITPESSNEKTKSTGMDQADAARRGGSPAPPTVPEKASPALPLKDNASRAPSSPPLSDEETRKSKSISSPTFPIVSLAEARGRRPSQETGSLLSKAQPNTPVPARATQAQTRATERRMSAQLPNLPNGVLPASANDGRESSMPIGAGIGAHKIRVPSNGERSPAFAAMMRNNSSGNPLSPAPSAAMGGMSNADESSPVTPKTDDQADVETPPREPSPPPEGEVEARAEWERAQMRRLAEQSKAKTAAVNAARKQTFRGQLKPLQLVAAEEAKQQARRNSTTLLSSMPKPSTDASAPTTRPANLVISDVQGRVAADSLSKPEDAQRAASTPVAAVAEKSPTAGDVLSTNQLQRMSARDSKLTASAISMPSGVTEIGGAYPVFTSPTVGPTRTGGKQYPGLMPQRSLVPPFELQNRPDGLPSALIGPDGVRRSPNDPDVCLECMMRDEDMIDVHVLGAGLWERESDKAFDDACRIEAEELRAPSEQASHTGSTTLEHSSQTQVSVNSEKGTTKTRLTKIRVKRVAKGDLLTAEALKLHTQMNPPASSHRWRTLQTFLAIQAKYIAMDQRARGIPTAQPPPPPKPSQHPEYDNTMIRTASGDSRRANALSQLVSIDERSPLTPQEKIQKEKDIVLAREARRRNAELRMAAGSRASLSQGASPIVLEDGALTLDDELLKRPPSAQMLNHENSSGNHSIPRRNNGILPTSHPQYMRAGTSAQDLRSVPHAMLKTPPGELPPSPASALIPPTPPFRSSTPQGLSSRALRATSSQMSLMQSGSMVDMHIGTEDRKDHRISQAGFLPGTPLHATSPSAFNRAYYGFPGDGDASATDVNDTRGNTASLNTTAVQDSTILSNDTGAIDGYQDTREMAAQSDRKQKKKGGGAIRGLFNKLSGKEATSNSNADESHARADADDDPATRQRKNSISADAAMRIDMLQPVAPAAGLLNRARRSTSSLLNMSRRASTDGSTMLNDRLGLPMLHSPGMASQASIDMGPFGSGPLPPPRTESRDPLPLDQSRARTVSSGNLFSKRKAPNVSELPVSSLDTTTAVQSDGQQRYQRPGSTGPRLSLTPGTASMPLSNEGNEQRFATKGANARQSGYRKSNLSEMYYQPEDGGRVGSAMGSLPERQSMFVGNGFMQGPWQGQMQNEPQQMQNLASSDQANMSSPSSVNRPMRPPRNPHRGTPSQPASEHTASEVTSGSKAPSPLTNVRRLSEAGPGAYNNGQAMSGLNARQTSELPSFMQSSQTQGSRRPILYNNASTPMLNEGMQSFPNGGADSNEPSGRQSTHVRSGSFGDKLNGYEADDSFNSQRSRTMSTTNAPASRRSRLLRLPFGKNKRESTATLTATSIKNGNGGQDAGTASLKSRSSRGTFDDWANGNGGNNTSYGRPPSMVQQQQQQYGGMMAGDNEYMSNRTSQYLDAEPESAGASTGLKPWLRNRRTSNTFEDRSGAAAGLPPRSQSALGMLDTNHKDADGAPRMPSSGPGKRGLLPRFRTASRNALRSVDED